MTKIIGPKNSSGFTLIETLVAILVLAVLIIGGSAMMGMSGRGILIQGNKRTAIEIASAILETERAKTYAALTESDDSYDYTLSGKPYPVRITRTTIGSGADDESKSVVVQVTYHGSDSVSFSFSRAYNSGLSP